ncbi:hypothetical protein BDV96DRAFT_575127 [Lophiotrema nucula]|uniref:Uncharacterized protein n=1 Tax=Lophiotrema nucula TaxID=690887 RepID=A0A6A5Z918_9PLEO|nr:hypothetical protein BDV96DRAFT_575127 [Lophiotrema nucula]
MVLDSSKNCFGQNNASTGEWFATLQTYQARGLVTTAPYNFLDLPGTDNEVPFIHWILKMVGKLPPDDPARPEEDKLFLRSLFKKHSELVSYFSDNGPRQLEIGMRHLSWLVINWDSRDNIRPQIRGALEIFTSKEVLSDIAVNRRPLLEIKDTFQRFTPQSKSLCLQAIKFSKPEPVLNENIVEDKSVESWLLDKIALGLGDEDFWLGKPTKIAESVRHDTDHAKAEPPVKAYLEAKRPQLTGSKVMKQMYHLASNWKIPNKELVRSALERKQITDGESFAWHLHEKYFCTPGEDLEPEVVEKHIQHWLECKDSTSQNECIHGFHYVDKNSKLPPEPIEKVSA